MLQEITFSVKYLKILRPKATKILRNLHKKFCEYRPRSLVDKQAEIRKLRFRTLKKVAIYRHTGTN